jgi:plasmid stabilization system protein ParE
VIDLELAADILKLADAIARMRPPQNSNPEAFHEDRSELASQARLLAARARGGKPIGPQRISSRNILVAGNAVLVLTRRQREASKHTFY